jgi:hypothetical protein
LRQVLWLNDNALSSAAGLEGLVRLKELWLARNTISRLGDALDDLAQLQARLRRPSSDS